MRMVAVRTTILAGLAVLLFALAPQRASAADDWTVGVDIPQKGTKVEIWQKNNGVQSPQEVGITGGSGLMLSLTTPYHVGFGLESYVLRLQPEKSDDKFLLDMNTTMLDVYVQIPVTSWMFFAPGAGWGQSTIKPVGKNTDFHQPETINLWQWYVTLGFNLPWWNLHARLGYREARGTVINRESGSDTESQMLLLTTTSVGLGWSF